MIEPSRVVRYAPTAVWDRFYSWDAENPERKALYRVERHEGVVEVTANSTTVTIPEQIVQWFAEAVAAAAEWEE